MKRKLFNIVFSLTMSLTIVFVYIYFFQEVLIFHPVKVPTDYQYKLDQNFEEINITTNDSINLSGILYKTDSSSKGLIFYLQGSWGCSYKCSKLAKIFNDLKYDFFALDLRGYGKSEGENEDETQVYSDAQTTYNHLKTRYNENNIIIGSYSLGTATAAMLASNNNPKMLIMQAPYYSLTQMMERNYPFLPTFLLKYKFETYKFIEKIKAPIVIFHGGKDKVIPLKLAKQLKKHLKPNDRFIVQKDKNHINLVNYGQYIIYLKEIFGNF